MKQKLNTNNVHPDDTIEQTTVSHIIPLLDASTAALPPAVTARLADARLQATALHARNIQLQTAGSGGVLHVVGSYVQHHRALISSTALACALLLAFVLTQHLRGDVPEQGDAFLLSSELPPEAYADKGFDRWLAQNSQR